MKKNRILLFSLVIALGLPLTVSAKIEHGIKKGYSKLQADGTYKMYQTYRKEDGNMARNEWLQVGDDNNSVGVSYFQYYGDDENILSNTTTPDGYLVNYNGSWYKNCPSAAITETEGSRIEHNSAVFFPFSYDGSVMRNDYLGFTMNYDETDYQKGIELGMRNYTCASDYAVCWISLPDGTKADVRIIPFDLSTDDAIKANIENDNTNSWANITYDEKEIGGQLFKGYRLYSKETYYDDEVNKPNLSSSLIAQSITKITNPQITSRVYRPIPGGASLGIEFTIKSPEAEAQLMNWLNSRITITK